MPRLVSVIRVADQAVDHKNEGLMEVGLFDRREATFVLFASGRNDTNGGNECFDEQSSLVARRIKMRSGALSRRRAFLCARETEQEEG